MLQRVPKIVSREIGTGNGVCEGTMCVRVPKGPREMSLEHRSITAQVVGPSTRSVASPASTEVPTADCVRFT